MSSSFDQGVVQIEPNSVWSIPCVPRVENKRIFGIDCLEKRLVFHAEICYYFEYLIFKYSIFHRVKELSKSNQTRNGVTHVYLEWTTKEFLV